MASLGLFLDFGFFWTFDEYSGNIQTNLEPDEEAGGGYRTENYLPISYKFLNCKFL